MSAASINLTALWAKTPQDKSHEARYHPLLCHLLDISALASLVWESLPTSLKKRLERSIAGANSRALIVFLSGAHDIGKASPHFQGGIPELGKLSGLPFSTNDKYRPHGFVSAHCLKEFLGSGSAAAALLGQIAGGHHGVFPRISDLQMGSDSLGNRAWKDARRELLIELASIVEFDSSDISQAEITDPFIVPILAGFISVVDWIGSNQDYFPCIAESKNVCNLDSNHYWVKAQEQARKALEDLGWLPSVAFAKTGNFESIFPFAPNALQEVAGELASARSAPYLMIVEAPMGHGKTEAALYAADLAMCRGYARGLYIAMPTQATGNAMYKRVLDDYLKKRGHKGKLNLQLVHGDALLAQLSEMLKQDDQENKIPEFKPECINEEEEHDADVEAQSWFTAKKRPLLAPFGVGTIDQSLLSVLQTKHWFVRLFGLAGKAIIFDEIHAYDAYMSTILERLLRWVAEIDCTVILLSATLPEAKRKSLVHAYSGHADVEYKSYPRITIAAPRRHPDALAAQLPICEHVDLKKEPRSVKLAFQGTDVTSLAETISSRLINGGCAAVICNTVDRSIEVYAHLRDSMQDTECILFHARTLKMWRREREKEVLKKFGKGEKQTDGRYHNPDRPRRAVLVATQIIEQSLDLDFDLMITEIAPVDLLLQRSGRLHRHNRQRPAGLKSPQFIVLCDAGIKGPPPESFGKSIEYVYDRYILLRTWLVLREREHIVLPTEIEQLIEFVYGNGDTTREDGWPGALADAKRKMEFESTESEKKASRLLISKPESPAELIEIFNDRLADDDDPRVHKDVRAATREGDPSITVVTLPESIQLSPKPEISEVKKLLDCSAKISHRGLFRSFLHHGEQPKQWRSNAHLRYARLLRLGESGAGQIDGTTLHVDEELGMVILKGTQK